MEIWKNLEFTNNARTQRSEIQYHAGTKPKWQRFNLSILN